MSARQRKRQVKTRKRRMKCLALAEGLPCPEGFKMTVMRFDYDTKLGIALERESDGARQAVRIHPPSRWKHSEKLPAEALARLQAWFEAQHD